MPDNDKQELNETEDSPERYTDEVTQSKIHKHLTDINDTISAEDIKNVDTNISSANIPKAGSNEAEELSHDKNNKGDDSDDNHREQVPTTWNVLD